MLTILPHLNWGTHAQAFSLFSVLGLGAPMSILVETRAWQDLRISGFVDEEGMIGPLALVQARAFSPSLGSGPRVQMAALSQHM